MIKRAIVLGMTVSASAAAQSIHGTVTERSSGARVAGAGIVLRDTKGRPQTATLADSSGGYRITASAPGVYSVSVQGRGLLTLESPKITLTASSDELFNAAMELSVKALPTVTVKDRAIVHPPPGNPHKYDLFVLRRSFGFGHFMTRADIESKPKSETFELFSQIAGIKVTKRNGQWIMASMRCAGSGIPGVEEINPKEPLKDPSWYPRIYIDGHRAATMETLQDINPSQIEAIEVYQGASQMPAEAKGDACFAIFIWMR